MNWHKKRPLLLEIFIDSTNKCFLVSTFLVKPLLHTHLIYAICLISVEEANGMLLNCHMWHLSIYEILLEAPLIREIAVYLSDLVYNEL